MICNKLVDPTCGQSSNPTTYVNNVVQTAFSIFIIIGVVFFVYQFIMSGFHFISSQGDQKKIESAKSEITYALVGLVVIFSVFAILKLMGTIFGISDLKSLQITWPTL